MADTPIVPSKSLYNDWDVSTEVGNRLFEESIRALEPIMKKYLADGYPIRQIAHEMLSSVTMLEAETCIRRNTELHRMNRKPLVSLKESSPALPTSKEGETQNG